MFTLLPCLLQQIVWALKWLKTWRPWLTTSLKRLLYWRKSKHSRQVKDSLLSKRLQLVHMFWQEMPKHPTTRSLLWGERVGARCSSSRQMELLRWLMMRVCGPSLCVRASHLYSYGYFYDTKPDVHFTLWIRGMGKMDWSLIKCSLLFCLNPSDMVTWSLIHAMVLPREPHRRSVPPCFIEQIQRTVPKCPSSSHAPWLFCVNSSNVDRRGICRTWNRNAMKMQVKENALLKRKWTQAKSRL